MNHGIACIPSLEFLKTVRMMMDENIVLLQLEANDDDNGIEEGILLLPLTLCYNLAVMIKKFRRHR